MLPRGAARALFALAVFASPLAAQDELDAPTKKLWLTLGGSIGTAGVSCVPKCSANRQTGPALQVRGVGQLGSNFALSLEAFSFRQGVNTTSGKGTWSMNWYMLGTLWYPNSEEDVFVNAAVGLATARTDIAFPEVGTLPLNFSDVGGVIGLGRDIRLGGQMGITMYIQYHMIGRSQALIGRANSGAKVSADILSAGLGFTLF